MSFQVPPFARKPIIDDRFYSRADLFSTSSHQVCNQISATAMAVKYAAKNNEAASLVLAAAESNEEASHISANASHVFGPSVSAAAKSTAAAGHVGTQPSVSAAATNSVAIPHIGALRMCASILNNGGSVLTSRGRPSKLSQL